MKTITAFFLAAWVAVWPLSANPLLMLAGSPPAAGGGGITDPTDIADCVLWLAADQGVYKDAGTNAAEADDAVYQWNDGSSNAKHFAQSSAESRPQLKTNVVNGKPVIRFVDGATTDCLQSASFPAYSSHTVFIVTRKDSGNASSYLLTMGGSTASAIISDFGSAIVEHFDSPRISAGASDSSAFHVYAFVQNAATPNTTTWRDGTQISTTGDTSTTIAEAWVVGATSTSADGYSGDIAEIAVYNSALSTEDREAVQSYLGEKYGITIN